MTTPSNTSAWVIVTGTIRDEPFLLKRLDFLASLKGTNLITQVVFSTWTGEVDRFDGVRHAIAKHDFVLIETDEPSLKCRGHYLHQIVSLENALDACPDNCFVLRTRTDKCDETSGFIEEQVEAFLKTGNFERKCADDFGVFDYKIGLLGDHTGISNHYPVLFFWNDRAYFGKKEDLKKLLNYNVLSFDYERIIPEQALFSSCFTARWPALSYFFRAANQSDVIDIILAGQRFDQNSMDLLSNFLSSNRLFRQAFLAERFILHSHFYDIQTGFDIPFRTSYREIELATTQEIAQMAGLPGDRLAEYRHFSAEAAELSDYLQTNFAIPRVKRYTDAPNWIATRHHHSPQLTLSLKARDL